MPTETPKKKSDEAAGKKSEEGAIKKSVDTLTGRATSAWGCGPLRPDTTVSRHAKVCPINNRYVCRQCSLRFASVSQATTHAGAEHSWTEGDSTPYHHDLRATKEVLDDVTWVPPPLTPRARFDRELVISVSRDPTLESLVVTPARENGRVVIPTESPILRTTAEADSESHIEVLLLRAKLEAQAQQIDAQSRQIHEQNLQLVLMSPLRAARWRCVDFITSPQLVTASD